MTETVRRVRLHRAAVDLIAGQMPVSRIARRAGYASQEAFCPGLQNCVWSSAGTLSSVIRPHTDNSQSGGHNGNDYESRRSNPRDASDPGRRSSTPERLLSNPYDI
jgi:AraC-like DNA-binding protein